MYASFNKTPYGRTKRPQLLTRWEVPVRTLPPSSKHRKTSYRRADDTRRRSRRRLQGWWRALRNVNIYLCLGLGWVGQSRVQCPNVAMKFTRWYARQPVITGLSTTAVSNFHQAESTVKQLLLHFHPSLHTCPMATTWLPLNSFIQNYTHSRAFALRNLRETLTILAKFALKFVNTTNSLRSREMKFKIRSSLHKAEFAWHLLRRFGHRSCTSTALPCLTRRTSALLSSDVFQRARSVPE